MLWVILMEMKVSQVGCFQLFLISHKMTYMGLAIVEIADRRTWKQNWRQTFDCKFALQTVQDMVLDSYIRKIASSQVTFSDVFNVIFEISRHLFLVFLLLTLNIVFFFWLSTFWATLHNWKLLSYRNETPPETSLGLFSRVN